MAQTKRKRNRKHRGNAAGIVERPAHNSRGASSSASTSSAKGRRPMSKEEMRADSRRRRAERLNRPPTWKGAMQRAAIAAGLFCVLIVVFFKENIANAVTLAGFMLIVYIPLSYVTDRALFNWRQKKGAVPRS